MFLAPKAVSIKD